MKSPYAPTEVRQDDAEAGSHAVPGRLVAAWKRPLVDALVVIGMILLIFASWAVAWNILNVNRIYFGRTHQETRLAAAVLLPIPFVYGLVLAIVRPSFRRTIQWIGLAAGLLFAVANGLEGGFANLWTGENKVWVAFSLFGMWFGCSVGGVFGRFVHRRL